jgi:hypothetical protein
MNRRLVLIELGGLCVSGRRQTQDEGLIWNALVALATGALLGVLVSVPYDRVFGLSEPLCATMQSLVTMAVLYVHDSPFTVHRWVLRG